MSLCFAPRLLADNVWLITGGGTGIGLKIAKDAVALGARVVLCGRREAPLREAVTLLGGSSVACFHVCDIRKEEAVAAMVERTCCCFGVVVCCLSDYASQRSLR